MGNAVGEGEGKLDCAPELDDPEPAEAGGQSARHLVKET